MTTPGGRGTCLLTPSGRPTSTGIKPHLPPSKTASLLLSVLIQNRPRQFSLYLHCSTHSVAVHAHRSPTRHPAQEEMGRSSQLRNNLEGISLWVLTASFTAACFVLQNAPYLRVYLTEECDKLTSPSQWRTYVLLLVNVAAGIPTAAATHFRTGLLAPPKATYQPGDRKYIGIDTLTGFKAATLFRQTLYLFLLLTPLPVFFLYVTISP